MPIKGRQTGGVQTGVFPDLDFLSFFVLFCPFLSLSFFFLFCPFLGLSRFFRDFPDLFGDSSGIFPICPFPLSRPINSAYEEQSRKGPRDTTRTFFFFPEKKWEAPRLSFSQAENGVFKRWSSVSGFPRCCSGPPGHGKQKAARAISADEGGGASLNFNS